MKISFLTLKREVKHIEAILPYLPINYLTQEIDSPFIHGYFYLHPRDIHHFLNFSLLKFGKNHINIIFTHNDFL